MDGSKLKTPHLVRGVHVCKDKNVAFFRPDGGKKGREEFKAGESSLNSLPRQEARGSGNSDKKRRPLML